MKLDQCSFMCACIYYNFYFRFSAGFFIFLNRGCKENPERQKRNESSIKNIFILLLCAWPIFVWQRKIRQRFISTRKEAIVDWILKIQEEDTFEDYPKLTKRGFPFSLFYFWEILKMRIFCSLLGYQVAGYYATVQKQATCGSFVKKRIHKSEEFDLHKFQFQKKNAKQWLLLLLKVGRVNV